MFQLVTRSVLYKICRLLLSGTSVKWRQTLNLIKSYFCKMDKASFCLDLSVCVCWGWGKLQLIHKFLHLSLDPKVEHLAGLLTLCVCYMCGATATATLIENAWLDVTGYSNSKMHYPANQKLTSYLISGFSERRFPIISKETREKRHSSFTRRKGN